MAKDMVNQNDNVASIIKQSSCSPAMLKLLMDIESEATGPQPKPKTLPKDHIKENFKRLKEIHEKSKYKKELNKPIKVLKHPTQYSQVQSKVTAQLKVPSVNKKGSELISSNKVVSSILLPKSLDDGASKCDEDSTTTAMEPSPSFQDQTDVYNHNSFPDARKVSSKYPTASVGGVHHKSLSEIADMPHPLGHVPTYLLERKRLWEEEEKQRVQRQIDASIPPGHTLLSDDERQETLLLLRKNQDELVQRLASLPVRNDTMRLRTFKEELEKQLAKVDEGIKIFSRPKVLIKNDA